MGIRRERCRNTARGVGRILSCLEEDRPELVNALRELVRQYRQEGVTARRHEIRRIRQARLFWQGLQYAWWNPNDMNWHLPFEQKFTRRSGAGGDAALPVCDEFLPGVWAFVRGGALAGRSERGSGPVFVRDAGEIVSEVNATSANAGVDPATPSPAPPAIAALKVQAANGWFDLAITDPVVTRGRVFFICGVGRDAGVFRAAGIFPRCVAEFCTCNWGIRRSIGGPIRSMWARWRRHR